MEDKIRNIGSETEITYIRTQRLQNIR